MSSEYLSWEWLYSVTLTWTLDIGHFCTFVNVLLYKVQFISFMYIIQIKMHDIFKVYFVEHVNVLIILRCFHIIVVYFIKNY